MKALPALVLLAMSVGACAQTSPEILPLLDRLHSYAKDYRDHLPSFSCDESITSQWVNNGKVKKEVKVEAVLREVRNATDPDSFTDHYEFKLVDGRPPKSRFKIPYFVQAVFSHGLGFGAPREQDACFDYQLTDQDGGAILRLEFAAKPAISDPVCKDVLAGHRKVVIVDAATRIIRHIDRSMSADAARRERDSFSLSIDYTPVKLGEKTFWLPVRFESHHWDGHRQMTATFSNCHRYAGELKIVPGEPQPMPATSQ